MQKVLLICTSYNVEVLIVDANIIYFYSTVYIFENISYYA